VELLFFTDISQLQYVLDNKPQLLTEMMPITGDIVVAAELERLGYEFIDEWDFLIAEEIESNWKNAKIIAESWLKNIENQSEYEGFYLSDCLSKETIIVFEACLNAITVYKKIFTAYDIKKIKGFFLSPTGVIRHGPAPTERSVRSLSQAILFWFAEKMCIPIVELISEYPLTTGLIRKKANKHLRTNFTESYIPKVAISNRIIVIPDLMSKGEHSAVVEALKNVIGCQVITLSDHYIEKILENSQKDINANIILKRVRDNFNNSKTDYQYLYPEIFLNTYLKFQFDIIWNELATAITKGRLFATILDIIRPTIIFFGSEIFTIEQIFVKLAQKRKILTIGLIHGGLGNIFSYRDIIGSADYILTWNKRDIEILRKNGIAESRLISIGCIRYEYMFNEYLNKATEKSIKLKTKIKTTLELSKEKPVILLISTAINTSFSIPVANPRKHRDALNQFLALTKRRRDLQFIIKPHPSFDYYELYKRMSNLNPSNLQFIEDIDLEDALKSSDICIMINYFTTACIEAMLLKVPVIYLNNAVYQLPDWAETIQGFLLNRVSTIQDLEIKIDVILNDTNYRNKTLLEADKIVRKVLNQTDKTTKERLIDTVNELLLDHNFKSLVQSIQIENKLFSQPLIDSPKDLLIKYFEELLEKHSSINILYVFTFLMGINNSSLKSVKGLYTLIFNNKSDCSYDLKWDNIWLPLVQIYVKGYNSKGNGVDFKSFIFLSLIILGHSRKIFNLCNSEKRELIIFMLNLILGRSLMNFSKSLIGYTRLIYS
jgi:hypothetical protein